MATGDEQQTLIFQDNSGQAVKFFLQKDLRPEVQAELTNAITSLGGRVESKVPRAGYILTQPGTAEEERLRICWHTQERPERHFVPWTYVEACKMAGMLLKQIFIHNGEPIKFHIHPSIANLNARQVLHQSIQHSGGDPTAQQHNARVILADHNTEIFEHLVKTYQGVADKYVESYMWVKKCIDKGAVVYTPLVYKNPGGRRPGEERTQFDEADEEHLCQWIAAKIPYKETGGRTGNRLYQQLCEMQATDPEYQWVSRHTWQSWRERYKKNCERLDARIAAIVAEKKPALGEKGQYGYVRMPEEKTRRPRKKRATRESSENGTGEWHELGDNRVGQLRVIQEGYPLVPVQGNGHGQPYPQAHLHPPLNEHPHAPVYPDHLQPLQQALMPPMQGLHLDAHDPMQMMNHFNAMPLTAPMPPAERNEQEMSAEPEQPPEGSPNATEAANDAEGRENDPDEGTEWQVRIGHAPPPPWATNKRKSSQEREEERKRQRSTDPSNCCMTSQSPRTNGFLPPADQVVKDIASEYRFTPEEVQEYFEKHNADTQKTRNRFMRMREELTRLFPDYE